MVSPFFQHPYPLILRRYIYVDEYEWIMTEKTTKPIPASLPWSIRGAETLLQRHPSLTHRWHYEPGAKLVHQ